MITLRSAGERGQFDHGWLKTAHTFSFGDYFHPEHMNFRSLRVINEDFIAPGQGFGTHAHHDMEILSYVVSGELEHKDSLGNGSVIRPGEVQRMSAGTGVQHSEFNPSGEEECHLLQIWLTPERRGLQPSYEQVTIPEGALEDRLCAIAAPEGSEGLVHWHQDAVLFASRFGSGFGMDLQIAPGRFGWVQVISGRLLVNERPAGPGDGVAISHQKLLHFAAEADTEFLFFDLA